MIKKIDDELTIISNSLKKLLVVVDKKKLETNKIRKKNETSKNQEKT